MQCQSEICGLPANYQNKRQDNEMNPDHHLNSLVHLHIDQMTI